MGYLSKISIVTCIRSLRNFYCYRSELKLIVFGSHTKNFLLNLVLNALES